MGVQILSSRCPKAAVGDCTSRALSIELEDSSVFVFVGGQRAKLAKCTRDMPELSSMPELKRGHDMPEAARYLAAAKHHRLSGHGCTSTAHALRHFRAQGDVNFNSCFRAP